MNRPEDYETDPLDALLREQPYVEDRGFTARVVASLPSRRARFFGWRLALLFAAAVIAWVLAGYWLLWKRLPAFSFDPQALIEWAGVAIVLASLVWASVSAIWVED